ncbi:HK97 gp10 family phage protein [Anaerophilus nitritogenes]|uniref:HK97 gp10 family phage protein n=1 Tax=Anaerophilus nitritogenes TaxID=2498136 RepID=UPI00101B896A|nr:HK97 gp10 family phage protein [Anaerophilus nitritogenes]
MAGWGNFNFSEFERMAKTFKKALDERVIERFIRDFLLEMAFRAERKIKRRTPVDTGQLRRSWQVGNIERQGNSYIVEIFNNAEYASFLEYGHRKVNENGWVEGKFMMTISMKEIERELPIYLERRMTELMDNILNGRPPRR